jgi:hypothetical protein
MVVPHRFDVELVVEKCASRVQEKPFIITGVVDVAPQLMRCVTMLADVAVAAMTSIPAITAVLMVEFIVIVTEPSVIDTGCDTVATYARNEPPAAATISRLSNTNRSSTKTSIIRALTLFKV